MSKILHSWALQIADHFAPKKLKEIDKRDHYFFANDTHFFEALNSIDAISLDDSTNACMLLVGNSYLLSSLSLLKEKSGATIVLLCDIDPIVLEYTLFCHHLLLRTENRVEFLQELLTLNNPAILEENDVQSFQSAFDSERKKLGKNHFYFSDENFQAAKQAHSDITLIPIGIDLFDENQIRDFIQLMPGKITLLNLTNVREWDDNDRLGHSLRQLPCIEEPIILDASHRETFGRGKDDPKVLARKCSIEIFNQSYIEAILFFIFLRRGLFDEAICQEIRAFKDHVNTKDSWGYTPIEIAALHFMSTRMVSLLLKHGAVPPSDLADNLVDKIEQYHKKHFHCGVSIPADLVQELEEILKIPPLIVAQINPGQVVFYDQNTIVEELGHDVHIIVTGHLTIKKAGNFACIQTLERGDVHIESFTDPMEESVMRIIAAGNVTLEADCPGTVDILSTGSITTKNIGDGSYLLAKNGIVSETVGSNSILFSKTSGITIHAAGVDVKLAVEEDGIISIENGRLRHGTLSQARDEASLVSGLTQKNTGLSFDQNIHASIIAQLIFKYIRLCETLKWPILFSKDQKSSALNATGINRFILNILEYTPTTFAKTLTKLTITLPLPKLCPRATSQAQVAAYLDYIYSCRLSPRHHFLTANTRSQKIEGEPVTGYKPGSASY